jgi:hypothetical protein
MNLVTKEILLSLTLGLIACFLPYLVPPGPTDPTVWASLSLGLAWLICLWVALVRYRRKGLWFLVGLPFVCYWPTGLVLMTLACHHNVRACP